jgi:hypothetical protein
MLPFNCWKEAPIDEPGPSQAKKQKVQKKKKRAHQRRRRHPSRRSSRKL